MASKRTVRAVLMLQKLLADGLVSLRQVRRAARETNLTWRTVERAKAELRVVSVKQGFPAVVVGWELPGDHRPYVVPDWDPKLAEKTRLRNLRRRARLNKRTEEEQRMYEWLARKKVSDKRTHNAAVNRSQVQRQQRAAAELRVRRADEVDE